MCLLMRQIRRSRHVVTIITCTIAVPVCGITEPDPVAWSETSAKKLKSNQLASRSSLKTRMRPSEDEG